MSKILMIDDEVIYRKIVGRAIRSTEHSLIEANDGKQGLELAQSAHPDLIICDVVMPEMDGYEFTRQLRRILGFERTPILILTAQFELEDRIKAFEAGADGHLAKPFDPPELVAWVDAFLKRAETANSSRIEKPKKITDKALTIAVHSLRGGAGCSSFAVNLGVAFNNLWGNQALLIDAASTAGQVALLLNSPLRRTWADIIQIPIQEIEAETLETITGMHESGLRFIAAPTQPVESETLTPEFFCTALELFQQEYEYIVIDLPHDFSKISQAALNAADLIFLVLAPEMASLRSAIAALNTYTRLGYPAEKIRLVLNRTFKHHGLSRQQIEKALHSPLQVTIPHAPDLFIPSLNYGRPVLFDQPNDDISILFEKLAFRVSKPKHRHLTPTNPTKALERLLKLKS